MRRLSVIILVTIFILIVVYIGLKLNIRAIYHDELKTQKNAWMDTVFIPMEIKGIIYELNEPKGSNCFTNLIIKKVDGEKFACGICLCDSSLFNMLNIGDTITKVRGKTEISIQTQVDSILVIDFPFCK